MPDEEVPLEAKMTYCMLEGKTRERCLAEHIEQAAQDERLAHSQYDELAQWIIQSGPLLKDTKLDLPDTLKNLADIAGDELLHAKLLSEIAKNI